MTGAIWCRYATGLLFLFLSVVSSAQPYGREWIVPDQTYYRIPVGEDGIYRISYQTLLQAGAPVATLNPKLIQLWNRGVEQYVYIQGESDFQLDPTDFIEFVAWKNRGQLDQAVYRKPGEQPHQFYNLFTDTNAYFLTWTVNTPGKRLTSFFESNYGAYTPEPYYLHREQLVYTELYHDGSPLGDKAQLCEYTDGEGWMGNLFTAGATQNRPVAVSSLVSSGPNPVFKFQVYGKSDAESLDPDHNHHLQVLGPANQVLADVMGQAYYRLDSTLSLDAGVVNNGNNIFKFRSVNDLGAAADAHAVSYIELQYPRSYQLGNKASLLLPYTGFMAGARGLIQASGYPISNNTPLIFDTLYHLRIQGIVTSGTLQVLIPNQGAQRTLVITDSAIVKEAVLEPVQFRSHLFTTPRLCNHYASQAAYFGNGV